MGEVSCTHDAPTSIDKVDKQLLETTVNILSAMADVQRLRILLLLSEHEELCVSEISLLINDKANTISMRLKKLYDADLVSKRREAKHIFYRLKDEHVVKVIRNAIDHAKHS